VNPSTVERLLDLNADFYSTRGRDFSATRLRLQPGALRFLDSLHGDETILDLGCGNGGLARELSRRGHKGFYLGVDLSPVLLEAAQGTTYAFPVKFMQADLMHLFVTVESEGVLIAKRSAHPAARQVLNSADWQVVTAFAVLHHIPSQERRLEVLRGVHSRLQSSGRFVHSNWQFSTSSRLKRRIQQWSIVGISNDEIDAGDYLLDWRRGGIGMRYVHEFDAAELNQMAAETGFRVEESYFSDGADRRSGLYQVWRKGEVRVAPS
jgi:tRNA (uracil-5-)-methyltransferase TRM9